MTNDLMREAFERDADTARLSLSDPFIPHNDGYLDPLHDAIFRVHKAATQSALDAAARVAETHENPHGYTTDTGLDIATAIRALAAKGD